jgi:glycosyltransferase involved in cell wall biosynthesis
MNATGVDAWPTVWILMRDLSATGVPIVLERLLSESGAPRSAVHLVTRFGGPLLDRLGAQVASCTVLEPGVRRSAPAAASAAARVAGAASLGRSVELRWWHHLVRSLPSPDVVLVHGAGGWPLVGIVSPEVPVLLHLHELDLAFDRSIDPLEQRAALRRAVSVLAVSRPVADLAVRRGATPGVVEILPGVVDVAARRTADVDDDRAAQTVMGAGTPGWRKGTDRVIALAHHLSSTSPPASVGWVGGAPGGTDSLAVDASVPVHWHEPTDDPWSIMAGASVVVVPSREDPLPLVALEAGLHGRAVVATPTGGLPELLGTARGVVLSAHDVGELCDTTTALLADAPRRAALGAALHDVVVAEHDARVVAPRWSEAIRAAAGGGG